MAEARERGQCCAGGKCLFPHLDMCNRHLCKQCKGIVHMLCGETNEETDKIICLLCAAKENNGGQQQAAAGGQDLEKGDQGKPCSARGRAGDEAGPRDGPDRKVLRQATMQGDCARAGVDDRHLRPSGGADHAAGEGTQGEQRAEEQTSRHVVVKTLDAAKKETG